LSGVREEERSGKRDGNGSRVVGWGGRGEGQDVEGRREELVAREGGGGQGLVLAGERGRKEVEMSAIGDTSQRKKPRSSCSKSSTGDGFLHEQPTTVEGRDD
jgi:hypothetical protein